MTTETTSGSRRTSEILNQVPLVPQTTGMSCWAAAAAMIIGWRDSVAVDPAEVAAGAGRWAAFRDGLHAADVAALARAWRLVQEAAPDWSIDGFRQLLTDHGPVWLGEASPGLHSIVIVGMRGDGTPDGTRMFVNDPWPVDRGERYTLTWRQLTENHRAAGELLGARAHVLHAGGRRGANRFRMRETHWTRSTSSDSRTSIAGGAMHTDNGRRRHHEEYPALFGSPAAVAIGLVATGERYIDTRGAGKADPLHGHGGTGENLYLAWNELPDDVSAVDVVVYLHGYDSNRPSGALLRAKVAGSGIDLGGRARPTLALVPRGRQATREEHEANSKVRADRYTFPALLRDQGAGLERLVQYGLEWLAREVLGWPEGVPAIDRVILMAHSGGGAALDRLLSRHEHLRVCNPDEVHVFDALYGSPVGLISWLRARLAQEPEDAPAGACRILFRGGTAGYTNEVIKVLPKAPKRGEAATALQRAYRAEHTAIGHSRIPGLCSHRLLRDASADVPLSSHAAAAQGLGAPVARGLELDDDARAWLAASAEDRASYAEAAAAWIRAPDHSAVELLPDPDERRHFFAVDWKKERFPGKYCVKHCDEGRRLFAALAGVVPERRVHRSMRYRDVSKEVQKVPGSGALLYPEASDSFVRMRAAARADGVPLTIGEGYRTPEEQARRFAANPDPMAVAKVSAHMYGLAVDLRLRLPGGVPVTTKSMPSMFAAYSSSVYKWMALHARDHGWYPYSYEPWHWEYNPEGFARRFDAGAAATGAAYGAPLGLFAKYAPAPGPRAPAPARLARGLATDLTLLDSDFQIKVMDLLEQCREHGVTMVPYQGLRDPLEQARLWRQSRSTAEAAAKVEELREGGAPFLARCLEYVGPQKTAGHVTNAAPGLSWHQFGEGIDCYWEVDGKAEWSTTREVKGFNGYHVYADVAEAIGLTAGGHWRSFKDWGHVQLRADDSPLSVYTLSEIDAIMGERFGSLVPE